jgi:hypothetical protein
MAITTSAATISTDSGDSSDDIGTSSTGSGVLVVETQGTTVGGWEVTLRLLGQVDGVSNADGGAIVSQVETTTGVWRTLGRFHPSDANSPLGVCALRDRGRVVFPVGYGIDYLAPALRFGGQGWALTRAEHSRLGVLGDRTLSTPGAIEMSVGDAITANYSSANVTEAVANSWHVLIRPTGETRAGASPAHRQSESVVPTEFALQTNHPNPFSRVTTIGFALPRPTQVRLEVFDLLGRRVRTLASSEYPVGEHSIEWDGRQEGGAAVRGGVYLCRMIAGAFTAKRMMVLLP